MKALGFMTLHYGKEYFRESLLSIINHVDKMVISYTKYPSHGHSTNITCPDSEREMKKIAEDVCGSKLVWEHDSFFSTESEHRNKKYKYSDGFDLVLTIDADEVYKEDEINNALLYAYNNKERYYGLNGYINFWRSFDYACYDGFRPIRIENLHNNNTLQNHNCNLTVYHFSTCQSESIMRYKYNIFGHASEVREGWLDNIYYEWTPSNNFGDVHCVALGLWNPVRFDKDQLPIYLKQHENFNKTLV